MNLTGDKFTIYKKASEPLYKVPKSIEQTIEIKRIAKNGIFEAADEQFSRTYEFSDINYVTASVGEQERIFEALCKFLDSMDAEFQITFVNKNKDMSKFRENVLFPMRCDEFDNLRENYNSLLENAILEGRQGIEQKRYLTLTVKRKTYEEARIYFHTMDSIVRKGFAQMGSEIRELDAKERLRVLHDFYRLGEEEEFSFDFDSCTKLRRDYKSDICNSRLKYYPTYIQDERKVTRALFVKKFPVALSDRFLNDLAELPVHSVVSVNSVPIPKEVTTQVLERKYMGIESDIIKQQRIRNKNLDFSSEIAYRKRVEKEEIESIMDDVRENDQRLFFTAVTILICASSKEELDSMTANIIAVGKRNSCQIEPHYLKQREALNTALPVGVRQVETMRTLLTQSVAALMPFHVQELSYEGPEGIYYGSNQESKNLLIGNRKFLMNGNGFVFGVSGSGKSFFCKAEMVELFLNTNDEIIAIDPQHEYFELAEKFGGQTVVFSNYTRNYINPLLLPAELDNISNLIADKSDLMLGICEKCKEEKLGSKEKSIIERCVREVYAEIKAEVLRGGSRNRNDYEEKTLEDFYRILLKQEEKEAEDLALAMERFISGTLNIFAHKSNVDINNRFLVYGIRDMGKSLSSISTLIMLGDIKRKVLENSAKGIATWIYIDEFHVLLDGGYTESFFAALWKEIRKLKGMCTGITQNVINILESTTATTMLANSEFVALLKQSMPDYRKLAEILNVSDEQLRYVIQTSSGMGLLKYGSTAIPFDLRMPRESPLYQLYNTNPYEKIQKEKDEK